MGDQEDIMLTFRQKLQLNNNEHMFFRQGVDSWKDELQKAREGAANLEDISYAESSDEEDELLKKGKTLLGKGEWARAISTYTCAISKNPTAKYYTERALAFLKRRNLAEAERDCTEAINLDEKYTKAYIRRALARKLLGKCKECCEDLAIVLKVDPDNEIVAMEYESLLDYHQKNLQQAEDVDNDKIETAMRLKQLGNDLVSKCEYKKALEKFTSAIKLHPKEPTLYANRAICRMKLRDFVCAEKDCSRALELDGKYGKVYLRRGRVRKCLGKLYESRQDFYSAFELTGDEKVLEEVEEVEKSIRQKAQGRDGGEMEDHEVYSVLEKDDSGQPKPLQLDSVKMRNLQHAAESKMIESVVDPSNHPVINQSYANDTPASSSRNSSQQTNTKISIPTSKTTPDHEFSSKYDIREVFPLKRDDPSVKFSGPFVRVRIEDGNFAAPDKLLEIPHCITKNFLP